MCGIVGIIDKNAPSYKSTIEDMKLSIYHRGPDGNATEVFDNCILGHVRLSIIDILGGQQPMYSANKEKCLTFNGEIYNYLELEKDIDYAFQTRSDTEIILALYEKENEKFVNKLKGMFAFALWDEKEKKLFCARDRFGEKPFYYAFGKAGEFIFASEIKAIIASGLVDLTLDRKSLAHYMQRLYVPIDKTIYENIYILPAAHQLTYKDNHLKIEKYWELPKEEEISLDNALGKFSSLFDKAVERQLISDVETGAFLSGGLDSSSIVAIASKYNKNLKTFSFGFSGDKSELPFAKEVANRYKTEHFEFIDEELELASLLVKMQSVYDEPFADSSNIPTYIISQNAREQVKVVLSGDGGDELLGGYSFWYKPLYHMQNSKDVNISKYFMAKLIRKISNKVPLIDNTMLNSYIEGAKLRQKFSSIAEAKINQSLYFTDDELEMFKLKTDKKSFKINENGTINDALRIDLLDYMPGDILTKVDRASMANSLEVRAPFLDPDFSSFCISLPSALKIDSYSDKKIMREAFEPLWPESIHNRPKQGFGAPVDKWLQRPDMQRLKIEFLEDPSKKIFTVLEYNIVKRYLNEDCYKTWILLVLSIWMETHEFK